MDICCSISALIFPPKHWRDGSVSPFPVHWRVSPGTRLHGHRLGFGGLRDFFLCSASLRWFAYSITIQNVTRHDLQFPKPWKLSSFAASFGHFALSDDPLRVQKHATRSSPHISSRVRKRPFSWLQGERSQRSFSKVSKIYVTSTQPT